VIDCEGSWSDQHRGFIFQSGEDTTSVLQGFIITNGYNDNIWYGGGAIYCGRDSTSAKIIGNRIIGNVARDAGGGGISVNGANTPLVIRKNYIANNRALGAVGIRVANSVIVEITGNVIVENEGEHDEFSSGPIGGLYVSATDHINISYNTIADNYCYGYAGGVMCSAPNVTMIGNTIVNNTAWGYSSYYYPHTDPGHGGGVYCWDSNLTMIGNTIAGNIADEAGSYAAHGGGLFCSNSTFTLIGNTITDNIAQSAEYDFGQGGGVYCEGSVGVMTNNVFWNDQADEGEEIALVDSTMLTISHTDVGGGAPSFHWEPGSSITIGLGNVDADPLFVDPGSADYHLQFTSPCINAGDPYYVLEPDETDIDGESRVMRGRIDMGVDEVPYPHFNVPVQW